MTHDHIDHISGIGVLSRRFDIPVFANAATWRAMEDKIGRYLLEYWEFTTGGEFELAGFGIKSFPIPTMRRTLWALLCKGNIKISVANDLDV